MFPSTLLLFTFILNLDTDDAKPNPYCNMSCGNITHACCKFQHANPGPKCKSPYNCYPMSGKDRAMILMMHNAIRNNIASGMDPFLPHPSSNMHALTYDLELEFLATCWATQCRKKPYGCLNSLKGQAAHHVWQDKERTLGRTTGKKLLTHSLYTFYKQLETMDRDSISSFKSHELPQHLSLLSQVLWANTQYVGCSRVSFGSGLRKFKMVNVVCVYYPKGNIDLQPVYKVGKPCSECPVGSHCHENYTSLCAPYLKRSLDTFKAPFEMSPSKSSPKLSNANIILFVIFFVFCY